MSNPVESLDQSQVVRNHGRAAADYDRAAVLQREVNDRLLERLDWVKLTPSRVLELGCATGYGADRLRRRYRRADVVAVDRAYAMLDEARRRRRRYWPPRSRLSWLCADARRLPLADGCADLAVSNLMPHWCDDPETLFAELRRVLRPNGLLSFSTFGPDTLTELRQSWAAADRLGPHVHFFADMHDVGDQLLRAGFADPVIDVEHFTLTYSAPQGLIDDLRRCGAGNALAGRRRGLTGPGRRRQLFDSYRRFERDGVLPATFEVVYGHAWAPQHAGNRPLREGAVAVPVPAPPGRRR